MPHSIAAPLLNSEPVGLTPRQLIMELLDAEPDLMGVSARLVAAGEVFNFSANQMRVALSRLVSDELLAKAPQRGRYCLTGRSATMKLEIQRWRNLEQRVQSWQGDWCALVTDNLAVEGSTHFRAQTRALELRGMRRWKPGLWVRPNNLTGGLKQLSLDVRAFGLDALCGQLLLNKTDADCEKSLSKLWDTAQLTQDYRNISQHLTAAQRRIDTSSATEVLVETLTLGGGAIKFLLKDPLLPSPMLAGKYRSQLMRQLDQYDRAGRRLWLHFIQQL